MLRSIARGLPIALLLAGSVWAQAPTPAPLAPAPMKTGPSPTSGSDQGPFPPLPNGEVAITRVPEPVTSPPAVNANVANAPATAAPAAPNVQAIETQAIRERVAEERLDRAEREHERAREDSTRNAGTIEGAFTGLTGERDR